MKTVQAAVLGYQGFGNVGDEAILTGIEQLLAATVIDVTVIIAGGLAPVPAFPHAKRIATRRLLPTPAAIRALAGVRVLLMSGGGLLHDHWASVVPTYLIWTLIARVLGVRVVWIGVGVGPIRRRLWRGLTTLVLMLAALVTVRDRESAACVIQLAPGVRPHIVPDPAVFNHPPRHLGGHGLALIVRQPAPRQLHRSATLATALGKTVLHWHLSTAAPTILLTFGGPADDAFAERVCQAAMAAGAPVPAVEGLGPNPTFAMHRLASFDCIVTVRLHGLILGSVIGVPTVAIAYDNKVSAYARAIRVPQISVPLNEISAYRITEAMDFARGEQSRTRVAEAMEEFRRQQPLVAGLIAQVTK